MNLVSKGECASGKIPIYMLPLNAPSRYHFIIQQLDNGQPPLTVNIVGDRGVFVVSITPDESESDSEVCGIVGRKECEEGIYSRKAKEWVDSIIVTPHSQPINSTNRRKRAWSSCQNPKSPVQKSKASHHSKEPINKCQSSFKIRSFDHSSQHPTVNTYEPPS